MFKRVQLVLAVLFVYVQLCGQTCDTSSLYARAYWFNGTPSSLTTNILPGPSGSISVFGNIELNYNQPSIRFICYLTKINSRGTPFQTTTLAYNGNNFMNDACPSADGGYFIAGFTNDVNAGPAPWVAKLDAAANPVWSFGLPTPQGSFFKVVATTDGGCIVAGRLATKSDLSPTGDVVRAYNHAIVFKLDRNGAVKWGREFYTAAEVEQIFEVFQMSDGSVMVSGVKDNSTPITPGSDYFIMKLDKDNGQTIWQKESSVYFGNISELSNGDLLFRQNTFLYFVNAAYGSTISATGVTLPAGYTINSDMHYAGSFADKQDLYYSFAANNTILLFKMDNYDSIAWATSLPGNMVYGSTQDPFATLVAQNGSSGNLYLSGGLASQGLATHDSLQYEENSFVYKTSLDGGFACSDTMQAPFAFTSIPLPNLADFAWYGSGNLSFNKAMPLAVGNIVPLTGLSCYKNLCCLDTAVYVTVNMCVGGTTALPDGTVVNNTGLYSVILKRSTGCDSIVFITVNAVPPSSPLLGNDTCFLSPAPVILKANAPFANSYLWQDGSTDSFYTATTAGNYWVQTTNICGTQADSLIIYTNCSLPVYVPSAFSPNGDGRNDIFRIADMKGQKLLDFSIYNRWGSLVFRTEDAQQGWDGAVNGQKSEPGAYVYVMHYYDLTGKSNYLKGTFVLIR